MSTKLEAELAISTIDKHPKNPRHRAVADDDMVASVRECGLIQPVVVAPHPDKPARYVLIAGHRRMDAAKKAKRKAVPAVIRDDLKTEGQQIEAMIIENGHRVDLTPIEEAEGYHQLELLGYKPASIAAAVGRNIKTVRERLKLLKLSETTQKRVHTGQVTIEDAVAIGEFADDAEATAKLEQAATSGNLRYELSNQRQRRQRLQSNAATVAALVDAGATEIPLPEGTSAWKVREDRKLGYVPRDEAAWSEHTGCLAYIHETSGTWPDVNVYCTNPASHADSTDEQAARAAKVEQERQEREARRVADQAAMTARVGLLVDLLGSPKLPPTLRDLVRGLLPQMLGHVDMVNFDEAYAIALDLPEADRWDLVTGWSDEAQSRRRFLIDQHRQVLATASDAFLARALLGMLAGYAESNLDEAGMFGEPQPDAIAEIRAYYELLDAAGYVHTEPDHAIHTKLAEAESNDTAKAS